MPIYEYRCSACDHLTELLLGLNDPPPQFCPSCGAEGTMRKAFAPPAIVFKGSGWAKKDRATSSRPAASGAADKPATGSDGASSTDAKADDAAPKTSSPAPASGDD
jgi:putative FmdB family regulatory protein